MLAAVLRSRLPPGPTAPRTRGRHRQLTGETREQPRETADERLPPSETHTLTPTTARRVAASLKPRLLLSEPGFDLAACPHQLYQPSEDHSGPCVPSWQSFGGLTSRRHRRSCRRPRRPRSRDARPGSRRPFLPSSRCWKLLWMLMVLCLLRAWAGSRNSDVTRWPAAARGRRGSWTALPWPGEHEPRLRALRSRLRVLGPEPCRRGVQSNLPVGRGRVARGGLVQRRQPCGYPALYALAEWAQHHR
jgi:hypothetical protein